MKDNLFSDLRSVERKDDDLQVAYSTGDVTKRIWHEHLRPHMRLLIISGIAMAFAAATTGAMPFLIKISADEIFTNRNQEMIALISLAVIGVTVSKALSEYITTITVGYLGHRFIADLRIQMFERITQADLSWIEDVHSGRFLSGFLNDATLIRNTASQAIISLGQNLLKAIALAAAMFWMNWLLAILILICMPIGVVLLGRQRRKMRKSTTKTLQETGDLSSLITQTLRGIRIVRAYGQEKQEISRASKVINRALEFTMRGARARALSSPSVEALTGIGFAIAIYYAGTQGIRGVLTLGDFMGFMAAAMLIYQPLKAIASLQTSLQEGVAAASRVFGIIDHEVTLKQAPNAKDLDIKDGEIRFENISFAYEKEKHVFDNISFSIPAGKTVALVGPSGSGKSTIFNLVLRFYDPHKGQVLIDGQDISQVKIDSLRRHMALVTQDPILFDDTIEANISYGAKNTEKNASHQVDQAVIDAAKAAAAHTFIEKLPKGYQNRVGEAGNTLSGGERQRVAIARAIFKDAPILLLDEPTSALDSESEIKVQNALEKLMQDRTVLMIAHRLSTVKKADIILVLDKGQIVERGSHDELIQKSGLYTQLYYSQFEDQRTIALAPSEAQDAEPGRVENTEDAAPSPTAQKVGQ